MEVYNNSYTGSMEGQFLVIPEEVMGSMVGPNWKLIRSANLTHGLSPISHEINKMNWLAMDQGSQSYITFVMATLPWVAYAIVSVFYVLSIGYGRLRLHKKIKPVLVMNDLPGVSIIKPLMGVDPLLEGNLESHFQMEYPKFELLCCVQDEKDPAIALVNEMSERYPKVIVRMFIGGKEGVMNPMVQNMAPAYDAAKYDIIWVSTSRIRASTEILLDMVGRFMDPKVGLVHQMPFTCDQPGIAAAVEKVYFGSSVARYYLPLNMFGVHCLTGMSYLIKKSLVDELNGLSWFGRFLAEDFFLSKLLCDKGYTQVVAAVPAQQNVAINSVAAYKDRMVRWTRLRMNMMPLAGCLLEPLGESLPLGILMSWSMYHFFSMNPFFYFLAHWSVWCLLDYIQLTGIQNGPLPFGKFTYVCAWLIRETVFVFVYFEALLNVRHISWGKRTYRLSNFGRSMEIVNNKGILPI